MAIKEHLAILNQGVEVWNKWRKANPEVIPDLSLLDMPNVDLSKADFNRANLQRANLYKTNLSEAILTEAYLETALLDKTCLDGADLQQALCHMADFSEAEITDANLTRASLETATLRKSILDGSDLRGATLYGTLLHATSLNETRMNGCEFGFTILSDIDLGQCSGLEEVVHKYPSEITFSTIYLSRGEIPGIFLRGAGLPDSFITYIESLTQDALEYYSCFISNSSKNQNFAQRLHNDLQQAGVRCWFASEDMKIGDKFRQEIDQSIRLRDKLLVVLSEESINSEWVENEVEAAFEEEKRRGETVLFPVRLDDAVMETDVAWAATIRRTRHIGDFRDWKDYDSYQKAFQRLLRDLKGKA